MIPRFYHVSSKLLVSARVHCDARLTFSSSAVTFVGRQPFGRRATPAGLETESRETEGAVEGETEFSEGEREAGEELDRWLLAGEAKANESQIRSYKDPYAHFRKSVAPSFREPSPRKWLGDDVPFPLNPSFKPPIPLSDRFRTELYRSFIADPKLNSVRALAARHNISIKRVDAILRLKGMEAFWTKKKPVQTGFTQGMEHLLGVAEAVKRNEQYADELLDNDYTRQNDQPGSSDRYDTEEADLQDEIEGSNRARQRYQRLFWESVAEGEEPVMPGVLEARRGTTVARTKFKGNENVVERPGRPAIKFIDVGDAFVDQKEKERREREGARRSALKARKRVREHGLHA